MTIITLRSKPERINYIHKFEYLNTENDMDQNNNLNELEAELFNALAHPRRLEILELLRDGEACVCHIQAMLDQRQAYISQHLNVLRQAGLVNSRKDGLRVYYNLSDPGVLAILDSAKAYLQTLQKWEPSITNPEDIELRKKSCNCPQCSSEVEAQSPVVTQVEYV
jgi:DNA-binding transcriptional ArsR family regulator